MLNNRRDNLRAARGILDRLAVDGKRAALALGLIAVMAIMWFRVLTGQKPGAAVALESPTEGQEQQKAPLKISAVDLPYILGRNDYIDRNFFTIQDWGRFGINAPIQQAGTDTEVPTTPFDETREVVIRVAQKLRLEAVLWSENPRAFVNDRLLEVGGTISVKEGTKAYEFEVLRIYEESVLVGCNDKQVTLRITQSLEADH